MNYKIPMDFYGFFQKTEMNKFKKHVKIVPEFSKETSIKTSIDDVIDLLVFTYPGECKFAFDFGFSFWENEFRNVSIETFNSTLYPRKRFEENLKTAINKYEPRLSDVIVEVLLSDEEIRISKTKIKYFVLIVVRGNIKSAQKEPYRKNIVFSVGPVVKK